MLLPPAVPAGARVSMARVLRACYCNCECSRRCCSSPQSRDERDSPFALVARSTTAGARPLTLLRTTFILCSHARTHTHTQTHPVLIVHYMFINLFAYSTVAQIKAEAEADAAEGTANEADRCRCESFSAVDRRPPDDQRTELDVLPLDAAPPPPPSQITHYSCCAPRERSDCCSSCCALSAGTRCSE